jgi:acyl-CoA synthetase (AMP-forming)/AMP-acid ligase II
MDAEPGGGAFRDGWFYPGDIGRLDAGGLLCIAGRADEVMNVGGVKLLPDAVEDVVLGCAGVQDAAAFTAADVSGLERLYVAVVVNKQFDEHVAASAISGAFAEMPSAHFLKLPSIPRGMTAKIDREQLRRLAAKRAVALSM